MKLSNTIRLPLLIAMLWFLNGCGTAHTRTDVQAQNIESYQNVLIQEVKVYSNEEAAKKNAPLQEKLRNWETYSRNQLEQYIKDSKYTLINSIDEIESKTLLVDLDVNVQYGNRALRWAVGFGAGKGGVDSVLIFKDSVTGDIKYKAYANSDLSMGGGGGDIDDVLKKNIEKLLKQHFGAATRI